MKWTNEYFEQQDTTQPAEIFEDMLVVTYPKLRGKLLQITDTLEYLCELAVLALYRRKKMNRYEQRRQKLLQNKEVAAGYQEMAAELELMHAIDDIRKQLDMSQEQLAKRMGKKREAVTRLLSADDINPTLNTLIELLSALNLTADITLRQAREGEGPIKVATEIAPSQ